MSSSPFQSPKLSITSDADLHSALDQLQLSSDCCNLYEGIVKYCGKSKNLSAGRRAHSLLQQSSLRSDRYLANLLVEMYGKCGNLDEARRVFDTVAVPNVFSWTLLFVVYAQNGHLRKARQIFEAMPEKDVAAWNAMMNLYVENQDFDSAKEIFDRMKARDVFSWTAMITAYSHSGDLESAKACFDRMKRRNSVTWNAMLAAYIRNGHTVEAESFFRKIPRPDAVSWNSIISAVAKCGDLRRARQLFDQSPEKNVVTYNTMITSFVQTNRVDLAKNFFDRMEEKDSVSWNAMITGYAQSGHLDKAREMFDRMPDRDRDPASWNSMISGYALEGRLEDAKFLFDSMDGKRNLVSWNALIAGYGQNGYGKEAINLFKKMVVEFRSELPNKVTCISVLDACASSLSLSDGRAMHARIFLYGVQSETVVGNSLINMYGKCGLLDQAARILITMPHANSISWNTLIGSYAQLGRAAIAIQLLPLMICDGFQPCQVTFSGVLSACGHGGLWSRAREFFVSMVGDFGVEPIAGHYACVIDLLGRSGLLIEAQDLLQSTPQDEISCMSIVGASRLHGNCGIGSQAALRASQIDPQSSAPYVFLSSF